MNHARSHGGSYRNPMEDLTSVLTRIGGPKGTF